jgi:hypothetical protein
MGQHNTQSRSKLKSRATRPWSSFVASANKFLEETQEHALQGLNPGGYYQAIWCRDASFILRDWFLCGNIQGTLQQLYLIWSHQIESGTASGESGGSNGKNEDEKKMEKVVYGRGSPEMGFKPITARDKVIRSFAGALPTTIYQAGYLEVYGQNPDIDSTALMISATSWILSQIIEQKHNGRAGLRGAGAKGKTLTPHASGSGSHTLDNSGPGKQSTRNHHASTMASVSGDQVKFVQFIVPRMAKAVEYLKTRDTDNDGLLEQNHNEDWMDTALRAGKIVYSQASWILALKNFASFLSRIEHLSGQIGLSKSYLRKQAADMTRLADMTIDGVEKALWSEEDGCYIDVQVTHHIGGPYRTLTQDVCLYLVAVTENTGNDQLRTSQRAEGQEPPKLHVTQKTLHERGKKTLDALKQRIWKYDWPMDTEALLKSTGPWVLKPHQYHNQTFWPWITGIEMLARSRFDQVHECELLLSLLSSGGQPYVHSFFEWLNPITRKGDGAYPFRTGLSGVRIALRHIIRNINATQNKRHGENTANPLRADPKHAAQAS